MKFFIFILKEVYHATPSLTQMKAISIPGYIAPEKVLCRFFLFFFVKHNYIIAVLFQFYSKRGEKVIPFYANLPEVIVQRSLADPNIATMIIRYPVLCQEDVPIM